VWRAQALTDLGLTSTPEKLLFFAHEFWAKGETGLAIGGSPGTGLGAAAPSQAWELQAPASSSRALHAQLLTNGASRAFIAGAAKKFWMRGLMQVGGTPPTGTGGMGVKSAGSGIPTDGTLGYSTAVSATKWCFVTDFGNVISTVGWSVGGAFADLRVWRTDSLTSLVVNGETPVTSASARYNGNSWMVPGFVGNTSGGGTASILLRLTAFATELE
jgi:hypothetical protein